MTHGIAVYEEGPSMYNARMLTRHAVLISAIFTIIGCGSHTSKQPNAGSDEPAIPAASLEKTLSLAYLTGGDLGIGGGFLIGAAPDMIKEHRHAEAVAS